jgi:hypothetical protein
MDQNLSFARPRDLPRTLKALIQFAVVLAGVLPLTAVAQQLSIETDEYRYSANFDPSRISESRLRELLLLSPYNFDSPWKVGNVEVETSFEESPSRLVKDAYVVPLESCASNQSEYLPCGSRDILDKNFLRNAAANVGKNKAALEALNAMEVPKELESILTQFRHSLEFYSILEERRLEFLRDGDITALSKPIGQFDPSALCPKTLGKIEAATGAESRYKRSTYEWHNCLNSAWQRIEPEYPREDWRAFLKAYGVKERFTLKPVD